MPEPTMRHPQPAPQPRRWHLSEVPVVDAAVALALAFLAGAAIARAEALSEAAALVERADAAVDAAEATLAADARLLADVRQICPCLTTTQE